MKENFTWWFKHWCAFNMTALNHKCWGFRHLFHDIEKPFLLLFMSNDTVRHFYRLLSTATKEHLLHASDDFVLKLFSPGEAAI